MKPLLIVKAGSTIAKIVANRGDFEEHILSAMELPHDSAKVIDISQGQKLPDHSNVSGVVICGSHYMVTDDYPWLHEAAIWLRASANLMLPVLGICWGHQLLNMALGGKSGDNPNGREFGTFSVNLNEEAQTDPLLGGLGDSILGQMTHTQCALKLADGAVHLANSSMDPNQAFRYNNHMWGLQFHPEFDVEITHAYIDLVRRYLAKEGQDPEILKNSCAETPVGKIILQRFRNLLWIGY